MAALRLAADATDAGMSAAPGQVLISGTVRELLGGTDLQLASVGEREFKGLGEPVRVYAVSRGGS